jgi:chaperone modulatory protein CbpM
MTKDKKEPALECEEWFYLSLSEISSSFGVSKEIVLEIIDEGIVAVQRDESEQWRFDEQSLRQIRTVLRLNHDLGVNVAGAGLALQLLEEIEHLRSLLESSRN